MNGDEAVHEPVLCAEVLSLTAPRPGEVVLDATVGHGGHAMLFARAIGSAGRLIGLDVDPASLSRARERLVGGARGSDWPRVELIRANFAALDEALDDLGLERVDVLLADLGVTTPQLLDPGRGLTFAADGPLDMRLDDRLPRTAADLVNGLSESELSDLLFFNSQERYSRRIARRICEKRREGRIRTTSELASIVCSAVRSAGHGGVERIHPATRTFLALRMAVNRELENLQALLEAAPRRLAPGGRLAVISFHSGEDRIVKQNLLEQNRAGVYDIATKKPVRPSSEEMGRNPRSRSARLRVARRTGAVCRAT